METELTVDREKELFRELLDGIAARAEREQAIEARFAEDTAQEDAAYADAARQLTEAFEEERRAVEQDRETTLTRITERFELDYHTAEAEFRDIVREAEERYEAETAAATRERDDAEWLVRSLLDEDAEGSPQQRLATLRTLTSGAETQMAAEADELDRARQQSVERLQACRMWSDPTPPTPSALPSGRDELRERFSEAVQAAHFPLQRLRRRILPRLFGGWLPLIVFAALFGGLFGAIWLAVDPALLRKDLRATDQDWLLLVGGSVLGLCVVTLVTLYAIARQKVLTDYEESLQHAVDARAARDRWQTIAQAELTQREAESEGLEQLLARKREAGLSRAAATFEQKTAAAAQRHDAVLQGAHAKYPALLASLEQRRAAESNATENHARTRLAELDEQLQRDRQHLDAIHTARLAELRQLRGQEWQQLSEDWLGGVSRFQQASYAMSRISRDICPDWNALLEPTWTPPDGVPPALCLGSFDIQLAALEHGLPDEPRLIPPQTTFTLPALLPLRQSPSLLLKARDAGRTAAVRVLQAAMLRLLTSLPPGKVRFTIIDPVGLGENFAAFMHLADVDEQLISSRIWTETTQIEQQLARLTAHMEDVFQTYLRNEFKTIDEYNRQAGEVAEPYRVLVIANFPANFSEIALRRLVSIATSGPRCGVFLLASLDTAQPLPRDFPLSDLEQNSTVLTWQGGRFRAADPELGRLPLRLDEPPPSAEFTQLVRIAGQNAKQARRVEVPFDRIAPSQNERWTGDSRGGIDVPLGRAGATKLQHLRLGRGTSQHVLIAGKTGSGKSTLLHALVTNLALHYSPQEVEFYLIDFKKGVEFKTYATHHLPHARVIAIESDREFGVSALQRLDVLLKERGELFRKAGVQDLAGYRDANPNAVLPRVLLIVDEFQEFFVEDDALAQSAGLLLDRLIRQGRAFGVHVLLGSQTLAGAYSLARATLGQVAVRIALQCSETDAHLILSEDNSAARRLSRPGEAIYNDANGLVEGNHPFQVAWLDDDGRAEYLAEIATLARAHHLSVTPPIVFEGNIPADPAANPLLRRLLERAWVERPALAPTEPRVCWLGDAVAIKEPTDITFRCHGGSHLLMVGQSPEAAWGVMSAMLVALNAQEPPLAERNGHAAARFVVLNGSIPGDPVAADWDRLREPISSLQIATPVESSVIVREIAAEIAQRDGQPGPPIYLFIYDMARFRELRRAEDEYGFGGLDREQAAKPAQLFADILRDGPAVGVHVVLWCDSSLTTTRWLSRDMLRELETRVAFPMNPADSTSLIDSPAASRLGPHRALLYRGEQGTLEKFRPYRPPHADWLATIPIGEKLDIEEPTEPAADPLDLATEIDQWTVT